MDVMLTDGGEALDPNSQSVGNNRLHVLIAMNSTKYQNASIDEREKILNEIVETVKIWTGRFLVTRSGGHEEVPKEGAMNALRNIFALRAGQAIPKRSSMPNPSLAPISANVEPKPPMLNLPRQSSASMINSGPDVNMPELETLRLAAVNNLKKKKARQKIASRLEDKSGRNVPQPIAPVAPQPIAPAIKFMGPPQPVAPVMRQMGDMMAMKRQSSTFALSPDLMKELTDGIDDSDSNNRDPLPPTQSNDFTSKFI